MNLPKGRRKRKEQENDEASKKEANLSNELATSKQPENFEKTFTAGESTSFHECFACKVKDSQLIQCSLDSCDKYYHKKCLEGLPSIKSDINLCPLHICTTCYYTNSKNPQISKGDMISCDECPLAFHDKDTCKIPGTVMAEGKSVCPKHFNPEMQRNCPSLVQLRFCVECGCNDELVFCKTCPAAIHEKCSKQKLKSKDDLTCERCLIGKTVLFNDIVWAKTSNFRWWPAKVVDPKDIPEFVLDMEHFSGEFPVKFFGSDEYHWVYKGRVYPFFYHKINVEQEGLKHNVRKIIPFTDDAEASPFDEAVQLALAAVANRNKIQSVELVNSKKPPPFKYVKCNKPIGDVQVYTSMDVSGESSCGCNPDDKDPCGYSSECLNRSMLAECHPDFCTAGDKCQNQKFRKAEYAQAKPYWTEARGWGLKSYEDIKKGTFIAEYCGDLIDEEECERRIRHKQSIGDTNFYFCSLDADRIIDAGPKGNISRFMNHSCEPNCETQKWIVLDDIRVGIFAMEDIPAGSELTFDYQMDFSHLDKLKCNCGSRKCAGLIGKKLKNGVLLSALPEEVEEDQTKLIRTKKQNGQNNSSKVCSKKEDIETKKQNGQPKSNQKKKRKLEDLDSTIEEGQDSKVNEAVKSAKLQNGSKKPQMSSTEDHSEFEDEDRPPKTSSAKKKHNEPTKQNGEHKSKQRKSKLDQLEEDQDFKPTKLQNSHSKKQNIKARQGSSKKEDTKTKNPEPKKEDIETKKQNGQPKSRQGKKRELDDHDSSSEENDDVKPTKKQKDSKQLCFKCNSGGKFITCSVKKCNKSFHARCLASKVEKPNEKSMSKWECPCHYCKKCKARSVYQCYLCPNAYCTEHKSGKEKSDRFACPKHCDIE